MALQGIFYGTTANVRITPIIEWQAVQSVAGNYSDVTATLSYTKKNSNPTTGGRWSGSLTIGEETKKVTGQYIEVNQDIITQVMTSTVRIYHDRYGKASVTISATGGITNPSTASLQNTKISATVTLDTIPRASTISCAGAVVGKAPTITITRADASFTHTVSYGFGTLSGVIAEKTKETVVKNWVIPESFYAQLPQKSGEGTLTCITYSGDTKIGEASCKLTVTTDESVCKPLVTAAVEDTNPETIALTGDKNILVQYQSTALCQMEAEGKFGASITETSVNGAVDTEVFTNVQTGIFRFRAKDSRGYVTEVAVEKEMIPYLPLTARGAASRTDPVSGNARLVVEGRCFAGNFGAAENEISIRYRKQGEEDSVTVLPVIDGSNYRAEILLAGLDYTRSFTYQVEVADKLMAQNLTVTVGKGIPVFDWGENDFRFHVPVYLPEGPLADFVVETGTESMGENGTWHWEKWASGKAVCWGNRNFGDLEVNSAWGSIYLSPRLEQTLPQGLFAEIPTINVRMVGSNNGGTWLMTDTVTGHSTESTGKFRLCRPTEFTVLQAVIGFHCLGRWK